MGDRIYEHIAAIHGNRPWGSVLDAGTGPQSLGWLVQLPTARWTAVTAAPSMARDVEARLGAHFRPADRLLVGRWSDPLLCAGERYDVVLADYLLGAVDGFEPYTQDLLFERLKPLVGGTLWIVGLEPSTRVATDRAGDVVQRLARLRDAILLLRGERPYREYPATWIARTLERAGYELLSERRFPISYGQRYLDGQLAMCRARLERLADRSLASALGAHLDATARDARAVLEREGALRHGEDHVLEARPRS